MNEHVARSFLRLIAVVTILVGAILTSMTLLSLIAVQSTIRGATQGLQIQATGMVADMGLWAILANLLIAGWGIVLWLASPGLAQKLVS